MQRKFRARSSAALVSSVVTAIALGCSAPPEDATPLGAQPGFGGSGGSASSADAGHVSVGAVNPLGRARCVVPTGVSGTPKTVQEALDLLNALPKPTSVACFLESLARPLTIYATSSVTSAQPAMSVASPRVFLKLDHLWLSIVIDGDSSHLVEFGYEISAEPRPRSIKGELALPIEQAVPPSAPYDRVRYGEGTVCGLCHFEETRVESGSFLNAFSSIAFRPRPETRVSIDDLKVAFSTCDWQSQPHRCEMLSAVFGGGPVTETPFPDAMSTFF